MSREFRVEEGGQRLDRFLTDRLSGTSRSYCRELIDRGLVSVGGAPRGADYRLRTGEYVVLKEPRPEWPGQDLERWIAFEDDHLLVLRKPSGLLMHPLGDTWLTVPEAAAGEAQPNVAGLLYRLRPDIARAGTPRCGIVHRLDRQTSGALVAAKTPAAYAELTAAFADRRVSKTYRAIVLGRFARPRVRVDAPVGRLPGRRRMEVLPWGRSAETSFRVLEESEGVAYVEASPLTGRTHQIRVHLAELGHPVLGDPEWIRKPEAQALARLGHPAPERLMLHAYRLVVPHPKTGKPLRVTAPLPADFKDYWRRLSS